MSDMMTKPPLQGSTALPPIVSLELDDYEEKIRKFRSGKLDETKMQKIRLQFGTYAQRQDGVQMQRIKIPGGLLTADKLVRLADAADRYATGFLHVTTREDVQLYYVKLDEAPALMRYLAEAGITTREACGNTVRNITACYRAGTSQIEVFDVGPYAEATFRFLVRNKYNQNLGRKFKITFEGCSEDHSGLRIHDIGLHAVLQKEQGRTRRGFRVYLGGGLGGAPMLGHFYTDFLPEEELLNLVASVLRVFDRYGERKSRMKARLKFLIQTMGWEKFCEAVERERQSVGTIDVMEAYLAQVPPRPSHLPLPSHDLKTIDPRSEDPEFNRWVLDAVIAHRTPGLRGVHVRLKLGDATSDQARQLAEISRRFSAGELRISIEQNLYLPWVSAAELPDLYSALKEASLAAAGAETIVDVTTCPGSDTCRLGIASAKGLGSAISEALDGPLVEYRDLARSLKIKISGCPNGCAQHNIADIGFHAAALSDQGRTVPAYLLFLGGKANLDDAEFGRIVGRIPAKNAVKALEVLLRFYRDEREAPESFKSFVGRMGESRLKEALEPLRAVPSYESDPAFFLDWGHANERFVVRQGIKGECAGATIAETVPVMESAWECLAQAEAYFHHKEYEQAMIAAYDAAAFGARVPLYRRLVDPFTSDEALWEFENIFVLSGETQGVWSNISGELIALKERPPAEPAARALLDQAKTFISSCAEMSTLKAPAGKA